MNTVDINVSVGDEVLTGHWKNHREKVKSITTDSKGQPLINGKPMLNLRLPELMPKKEDKTAARILCSLSHQGWIDPNGKFYNIPIDSHTPWLREDAFDMLNLPWTKKDRYEHPTEEYAQHASDAGWIRVNSRDNGWTSISYYPGTVTEAAKSTAVGILKDALSIGDRVSVSHDSEDIDDYKSSVDMGEATNKVELRELLQKSGLVGSEKTASKVLPKIFLGGDCTDNTWRSTTISAINSPTPIATFIDPYDPEWVAEESIYIELADAATADLTIFYKGGEGTEKEKEFFRSLELPFEEYDDIDTLIDGINTFIADFNNKETITLNEGDTVKIEGIPVTLEKSVEVSTVNKDLIEDLKHGPKEGVKASILRIKSSLIKSASANSWMSPNGEITQISGNHDAWITNYIESSEEDDITLSGVVYKALDQGWVRIAEAGSELNIMVGQGISEDNWNRVKTLARTAVKEDKTVLVELGYDEFTRSSDFWASNIIDMNAQLSECSKELGFETTASIRSTNTISKQADLYSYGCVYIPAPQYISDYFLKEYLPKSLDVDQLNTDEATLGIETQTHITVLYGLHEENTIEDYETVEQLFTNKISIKTKSKIEYFDNEDSSVAYVAIESKQLEELHEDLKELITNEDKHDKYIPHMALAYLKPGERLKSDTVNEFEWNAELIIVSTPDDHMAPVIAKDAAPKTAIVSIIDTLNNVYA